MIIGYDLATWAVLVPVVLFAAVSKAGFGSGAAFAAAAILALILPPGEALALMLPLLMLVDLAALRAYWRRWDGPLARRLIAWGICGVALGAALYLAVSANTVRVLIGAMCLAFVGSRLLPGRRSGMPRWAEAAGGVAAGFTSFISHAGGPPVAMVLLSHGLGKTAFQATTVLVFWAINAVKLPAYVALGLFDGRALLACLVLSPVALIGSWLGVAAHHKIPERAFFGLTYLLLTLTGLRLIQIGLGL